MDSESEGPVHVGERFRGEDEGDDGYGEGPDEVLPTWGAVFGRRSCILLQKRGVPLGSNWTISVWFEGGAWLSPSRLEEVDEDSYV